MNYLYEFFWGIATAIFGLIAPGMLNMTALKISINIGYKESMRFSIGAITVIFIQSLIGVFFADWLSKHEGVVLLLKQVGIVLFFGLSVYFFWLAYKNSKPGSQLKSPKGNYFFQGIGMSALNMLAIPFYVAMALVYANKGFLRNTPEDFTVFCLGAGLGSFGIFFMYMRFANFIKTRVGFIARNMNVILGCIFVLIASSTWYNL